MRQATSRIRGWRPRPFPHAGGEIGPGDGMLEPEPQRLQGAAQAPEAVLQLIVIYFTRLG
jgi:hypothetical protein